MVGSDRIFFSPKKRYSISEIKHWHYQSYIGLLAWEDTYLRLFLIFVLFACDGRKKTFQKKFLGVWESQKLITGW